MNRQSQQLVVAGVVAFLTSGVITLAGLSAAQDTMHMDGGGTYPPPADSGGTYQQQQYQPMDSGTQQQQFHPMDGYHPMDHGTPSLFQNMQGHDVSGVKMDFQRDGPRFQREGDNFQDGPNFHPVAPDFGGKTGAGHGFRGDFGEKTGAAHKGGRFERKPMEGFDRMSGKGKEGVFGKGTSYPMKGAPGGFDGENGPKFDMSEFDQFVPKKSNANVDSLLDALPTGDSDAIPTLTAAQEKKVEQTLDKADTAEDKAVSGLQKIFDKKPTKSAATKATNHILTLVKQWVSVQKLADGIGDYESDVVEHAEKSASSFANTIVEACDAASDFFDGKWKGEKVCDTVMDQIGTEEEE